MSPADRYGSDGATTANASSPNSRTTGHRRERIVPRGHVPPSPQCICGINWDSPLPTPPVPTPPEACNSKVSPSLTCKPKLSPSSPNLADLNLQAEFGLFGFDARGGAGIMGKQIVADACGELATCHVRRHDHASALPTGWTNHHRHATARRRLPRG